MRANLRKSKSANYTACMDLVPKETQEPDFDQIVDEYAYKMGEALSGVARDCRQINKAPKKKKSDRIQDALLQTFELIGGVPRLAVWADLNLDKFYNLFGKQIPGLVQQQNNFNAPTQIIVQSAIPVSALDDATSVNDDRDAEA